jgi:hypothetical protein
MKHYRSSEIPDFSNCLFFRFIIENTENCIIATKHDGVTGLSIVIESYVIKLIVEDSSSEYSLESNTISTAGFSFVEIVVNLETGEAILYINGEDQLDVNTIIAIGDISNTEDLIIAANYNNINTGSPLISSFTFWSNEDWFTDLSEFVSEYDQYVLNFQNPNWPQAGPYAEQLVLEERIQYDQTYAGSVNLKDEIEIDRILENAVGSYNAIDADEITGTLGNLLEGGSGDPILYDQTSEFTGDRTLIFQGGFYLTASDASINKIYERDIVLEITGKTSSENATIFSKLGSVGGDGLTLYYDSVNEKLVLYAKDDSSNTFIHNTADGSLLNNSFFHCMIFIDRDESSGNCTAIYIDNISTGSSQDCRGFGDFGGGEIFKLGIGPSNNGEIHINTFKIWGRYQWLESSQHDSLVDQRYTDYKNGGIDYIPSIPITLYTWGDERGTIPMFFALNAITGIWELKGYSQTKDEKQVIQATADQGLAGVRLAAKYEPFRQSFFDDIRTFNSMVEEIEIPKRYEMVFKKIIMQSKPAKTWAALRIRWV